MDFRKINTPPSQISAAEILVEALEEIQPRGVSRVLVMCFDADGRPIGWLSNAPDHLQRIGLIETMKHLMLERDN